MTSCADDLRAGLGSGSPGPAPGLDYWWRGRESVAAAGARDGRFDPAFVAASVRRILAAWAASATAGEDGPLAAVAPPEAVQIMLHPDRSRPRARLIVRGLQVSRIYLSSIAPHLDPPRMSVEISGTGQRYLAEPPGGPGPAADGDALARFTEHWSLTADGARPWPWRLSFGYPEMVEDAGSYHFISRPESPAEYRRRTGRAWPATGPPARRFRIQADYAEHDEKIGGGVHAFVDRATAPSRAEAEQVAWPLIDAAVRGRLGPGDWRPSLSTIEVLWLIG
jgi:hypothetical protein